jgi:hypothetical protein
MSQLLLEEMILFLIHNFGIVTCTVSPLSRLTAHLLPFYRATYNFAVMKTFVTDISASIRRTDFIIGIWLWQVFLFDLSRAGVIFFQLTKWLSIFSGIECWDMYKFDANERVGVFLARCSVQHLVISLNLHLFIRLCLLALLLSNI